MLKSSPGPIELLQELGDMSRAAIMALPEGVDLHALGLSIPSFVLGWRSIPRIRDRLARAAVRAWMPKFCAADIAHLSAIRQIIYDHFEDRTLALGLAIALGQRNRVWSRSTRSSMDISDDTFATALSLAACVDPKLACSLDMQGDKQKLKEMGALLLDAFLRERFRTGHHFLTALRSSVATEPLEVHKRLAAATVPAFLMSHGHGLESVEEQ